jgi:hypothetical protein
LSKTINGDPTGGAQPAYGEFNLPPDEALQVEAEYIAERYGECFKPRTKQQLANERHSGRSAPFIKVGNRVYYERRSYLASVDSRFSRPVRSNRELRGAVAERAT